MRIDDRAWHGWVPVTTLVHTANDRIINYVYEKYVDIIKLKKKKEQQKIQKNNLPKAVCLYWEWPEAKN